MQLGGLGLGHAVKTGVIVGHDPRLGSPASDGLINPDGSFFRVGDPISNIASLNEGGESGLAGEVVSPRLQQPYSRQASFGWSHQINGSMAFVANVIHADGRDLNVRARLNSRPNGGPRRFRRPGAANADFMRPTSYAGDFQRSEQRVGQVALRWGF